MHVTKPVMAAEVICTKTPALIDPQLLGHYMNYARPRNESNTQCF